VAKLTDYQRKRHFEVTPEPSGAPAPRGKKEVTPGGNRFVVQKHAARRLHYDFRLEIDGVLKSWAVPKGPSLNPAAKRLAVETEDHPLPYADFEGVIPEGQYGAGTVMVWDQGSFEVVGDRAVAVQLVGGELKFLLRGEKLRGGFVLVKLRRSEKGNEWLLIKHRDPWADPTWEIDDHDGSVLTGRRLSEIAEGLPAVHTLRPPRPEELEGARKVRMPGRLEPMLATLVDRPFSDPEWLFEIKWDGVRALAWVKDGKLELRSRTGRVITSQYPELRLLPERVRVRQAILDGEIVVLDTGGRSDFERMQSRMNVSRPSNTQLETAPVTYYLFDLVYCDGYDLRSVALEDRKRLLRHLLDPRDPFRYSDHQVEHGRELFELAREQGLEGIVGKHARSPYVSRRSPYWMKFKVRQELEAVVGGWTEPRGGQNFGALLLGLYEGEKLRFIGGVGTGFSRETQKAILNQLQKRARERCPFLAVPETKEKAYWVEPELVARVTHAGWTRERRLRHPVFLALHADREVQECQWEAEFPSARLPGTAMAAPALAGQVLRTEARIEKELVRGREENVTIELGGKRFRLSNLNKLYFPDTGTSKRHLLAYYYRMADWILPFLRNRPLVLRRYPDGITGKSFFQKDAGESVPEWMETVGVYSEEQREEIHYFVANDRAALLYLTNLGCIDHNPWASRSDSLEHPDYLFFDLDPSEGTEFSTVVEVARAVYRKLEASGLRVFLKTSGATGFHLYVPIERRYTHEQVRTLAEIVGRLVAAEQPERVTQERAVGKRASGKVYIDATQNAFGRPLAAPYSVRAFPGAPISTPVEVVELRPTLRRERFRLATVDRRWEKVGDLWADFWKSPERLERALDGLQAQLGSSLPPPRGERGKPARKDSSPYPQKSQKALE
jgi:bifunctional non-homologous end joining protein LigD